MNPGIEIQRLITNVSEAFVGKPEVVARAVLTLIAGGHLLIEDAPGLGKTLLAKALAKSVDARFKRIQFTADLLPSDVTGVNVFSPVRQEFTFRQGPLFTNILLADEINRATPRTQSSLLEAMEEQHVTVDGEMFSLASPFFVMATQNPVELEGTYPLPFAQMDRFMMRLSIGYLGREDEMAVVRAHQTREPIEGVEAVMDCETLRRIQGCVHQVRVEASLLGYIVDLVRATRSAEGVEFGGSPRSAVDLQAFSRATALWRGRDYVLPDDVKEAARLILPHRLISRKANRSVLAQGEVIESIVRSVPVPV